MMRAFQALSRLRRFPRHLFSSLERVVNEIGDLRAQTRELSQHLGQLGGELARLRGDVAELTRQTEMRLGQQSGQLAGFTANFDSLCDELTRASVAGRRELSETKAELLAALPRLTAALAELGGTKAHLRAIETATRDESDRITRLAATLQLSQPAFPSWIWTPDAASRVRDALSLLTPRRAAGAGKIRVGRDHDGGYVMLDDFQGIVAAFSAGIADDTSWDRQVAERGIPVFQLDPTVGGPPEAHPLFHFEPLRLAQHDQPGSISLDTLIRTRAPAPDGPIILKIDIEGAEWDVLGAASEASLRRCRQILCEFHDLDRLGEAEFGARARDVFAALARTHFVFHVHGNNCGNFANVANVMVPQSLEISFALRDAYAAVASDEIFPTALDRPNEPGRADLFLGRFEFMAGTQAQGG